MRRGERDDGPVLLLAAGPVERLDTEDWSLLRQKGTGLTVGAADNVRHAPDKCGPEHVFL
jgi:hypothetical protein